MMRSEVKFVGAENGRKSDIVAIGGFTPKGNLWRIPAREACILIETKLWSFYIRIGEEIIELATFYDTKGVQHLNTTEGSNLIYRLPEYPIDHRRDLARHNFNERHFMTQRQKVIVDSKALAKEIIT